MYNTVKDEKFEAGETVLVEIGSTKDIPALYECQTTFSNDPMRDRFRVQVGKKYEYVSRREIKKIK
ncbi:hypothetical protein D3C87_624250 [compost metagenome]